jgi:hypothetical protein
MCALFGAEYEDVPLVTHVVADQFAGRAGAATPSKLSVYFGADGVMVAWAEAIQVSVSNNAIDLRVNLRGLMNVVIS